MKTKFLILISVVCLSCSHTHEEENSSHIESLSISTMTSSPDQTVLNFLQWYRDNGKDLANNLVLNSSGENWDSTKFYAVNFPATENYLKTITSTNMVSKKYTDKWRDYFKTCDQNFKTNLQNDGPPAGFDYDFITFSQEDPGLDSLEKTKLIVVKKDSTFAEILIQFPSTYQYKYHLSKQDKHWQIDDIENTTN